MKTAIVFLNIEQGKVTDIARVLVDMQNITEVFSISGKYDLVAIIRNQDDDEIADIVTNQMQQIGGIQKTETMFAFRTYSHHDLGYIFSIGASD